MECGGILWHTVGMTHKYLTATFIGFLVAVTLLVLTNPALLDMLT